MTSNTVICSQTTNSCLVYLVHTADEDKTKLSCLVFSVSAVWRQLQTRQDSFVLSWPSFDEFCLVSTHFPISKSLVIINIFETKQLQCNDNDLLIRCVYSYCYCLYVKIRQNNPEIDSCIDKTTTVYDQSISTQALSITKRFCTGVKLLYIIIQGLGFGTMLKINQCKPITTKQAHFNLE